MHLLTSPSILSFLLVITNTVLASTITTTTTQISASTCPFATPLATLASTIEQEHQGLRIRQATTTVTNVGSCPNGYFGCTNLGAPQACCSSTAICTTDNVNHVACCASGASCTGVIGAGATSSGSNSEGATATVTSGNGNGNSQVVSTNGIIVTAGSTTSGAGTLGGRWVAWVVVGIVGAGTGVV